MAIEKIDGVPVAQALKPPPSVPERADAMMGFAGRVLLAGTREHAPVVTVRSTDGTEVDIPVPPRMASTGNNASINFPLKDVAVIRLNNSIGNTELTPIFDDLMKQAKAMRTVILDLRNTPSGGDSVVAKPLMAWFVEGTKGYQKHERGSESWIEQVEGRKDRFKGKLIVLVDHWTGSMGEGTAIGLRAAAGATIVGTPMAGLRGAIESFDVPCFGISLRIPVERLYEVNGTPRELAKPDVLVTEEDLAAAQGDAILNRALMLAH
jgi:carboxyl-terminal processing protease